MLMLIIIFILAILFIIFIIYFSYKNKSIKNLKREINKYNNEIIEKTEKLKELTTDINNSELLLKDNKKNLDKTKNLLIEKQQELNKFLENNNVIKLEQERDEKIKEINKTIEEYQINQQKIFEELNNNKKQLNKEIDELAKKRNSILKINKEEEEIKQKIDFYKLKINNDDLMDIKFLETIKPSLHRQEIISKLIYKTYYEVPYNELIGRVIGHNKITGIYKLTNLENNMTYIGQSVDIGERWRQHIKRALGAESGTGTNIKLYNAMKEIGPQNFSWQVVEECKKDELTAKEKYWIQFYDGQGYGYNTKG